MNSTTTSFLSTRSLWVPEWKQETSAWLEHAPFAFWLVEQLQPRSVVELGTHTGYSYMAFCQAVRSLGLLTNCAAVDTWHGDPQAGFYGNEIYEALELHNQEKYASFSRLIRTTFDEALPQFPGKSVDLLHIDGLHTYEAVKHDFDSWLPTVSDRGVVLFHDTAERENNFGVWQLWGELIVKYPHFEFLHGHGLGVLGVGADIPPTLRALFAASQEGHFTEEIRTSYERLGKMLHPPKTVTIQPPPDPRIAELMGKVAQLTLQISEEQKDNKNIHAELKKLHGAQHRSQQTLVKKDQEHENQSDLYRKIIRSAQSWQARPWWKRAFHKWRAPALPPRKKSVPTGQNRAGKSDPTIKLLNSIFSQEYYLSKNPQVANTELSPLEHYRTIGWREKRNPHPMFDVAWYLEQNPTVEGEPLQHYLEIGWKAGLSPHRFFDPVFYLERNPHLEAKGLEPLNHYLRWGWKSESQTSVLGNAEWHQEFSSLDALVSPEEIETMLGSGFSDWQRNKDSGKPVILLVTHDSSLTGAPIILLNLAKKLRAKYTTILIDLRSDTLQETFQEATDYYIGFSQKSSRHPSRSGLAVRLLLERCPLDFAVVNSVASASVLPILQANQIPIVHLIHEFAGTWRPAYLFYATINFSGKIVFPARCVLEDALQHLPKLQPFRAAVVPQGLCQNVSTVLLDEKRKIHAALRPEGWENAVVIIGVGTIYYRKGVDLFLMSAAKILKKNPEKRVRFVWIGKKLNLGHDGIYSAQLENQLEIIAPDGEIIFLDPVSDIATVYALADILFLSSRQDPFPLVAQEAMQAGLPIVCFASTTGIAELLREDPDTASSVVPYLDIEVSVTQLQTLVDDVDLRRKIGEKNRELARRFDFENYVEQIETLAQEQVAQVQQKKVDYQVIEEAAVLNLPYLLSPAVPQLWGQPLSWYLHIWKLRIHSRKPFPGFHPGIYAERIGLNHTNREDPLAHYLRVGRPPGPWKFEVIAPRERNATAIPKTARIALHIHLFYGDMADEIATRLRKNQTAIDLFITVPDLTAEQMAREKLSLWPDHLLEIQVVPNCGRDIGPFFTALGGQTLLEYDLVGHIHTKKSLHATVETKVELWTDFVFENTIGGKYATMDAILSAMLVNPQLGMVFPDDPGVYGWDKNRVFAEEFSVRLGFGPLVYDEINFPVGTFFWARPAALKKIFDLEMTWEDYPQEPVPPDGSLLHAMERILPLVVERAGYEIAVTAVPGFTR